MKVILRIFLLAFLFTGTFSQEFDLGDALDDPPPKVTPKPKEEPKAPPPKLDDGDLNLLDAFGEDPPVEKPKKPTSGGTGDFSLDLEDALGPEDPKKPAENPSKPGGGGGSFSDSDLFDVNNNGGYEPEGGPSNGGNSGYDSNDGAEQPKEGSGTIAAIASSIGVALMGAAGSYFAYQKKKLCFKLQGGQDPESGKHHQGGQSDNQVFSNLMRNS